MSGDADGVLGGQVCRQECEEGVADVVLSQGPGVQGHAVVQGSQFRERKGER